MFPPSQVRHLHTVGGCDGGEPAQLSQLLPFSPSSASTVQSTTRKATRMPYEIQSKRHPGDCPPLGVSSSLHSALLEPVTNSRTRLCLFTAFVILNSSRKCRFLRGRSSFKAHYSDKQPEQPWLHSEAFTSSALGHSRHTRAAGSRAPVLGSSTTHQLFTAELQKTALAQH